MGYDTPKKLGDKETGGGLSLPIWINFMEYALKGVPVAEYPPPEGVVNVGGEWYYNEYARGGGVTSLGGGGRQDPPAAGAEQAPGGDAGSGAPASEEKNRILDLFKN